MNPKFTYSLAAFEALVILVSAGSGCATQREREPGRKLAEENPKIVSQLDTTALYSFRQYLFNDPTYDGYIKFVILPGGDGKLSDVPFWIRSPINFTQIF